jgi:hypothetical protein
MTSTVIEILKGAREILSEPARWHKGDTQSADGSAVCLRVACMRAAGVNTHAYHPVVAHGPYYEALIQLKQRAGTANVEEFNDADDTTHQDVLDLLDKTLADLGGLG